MDERLIEELRKSFNDAVHVKVKLEPGAIMPKRMTKGASGFDLFVSEDVIWTNYFPNMCKVNTGVRFEIPEGYEGQVRLRSSMSKTCSIMPHGIGTIDPDYRGLVFVPLLYMGRYGESSTRPNIRRGDRIAQIVFMRVPTVELIETDTLSLSDRGEGAFGSSGR
jgi:dUTP pyrophosphatase